ncbi:peptidylprolyl isomerase PrsA [Lacticaseibacillus brantae]|uniref:Foldase protein PrsA n=1 Tax=Lacticaseibacillus brantae DSM 23927 TaxID=1423727 RepID=A0A0R2B1K3_9LACO|nr:peptidylprolyl isomerase PrsA [Lacticaseibacillus brantae]KRM72901.1 peptidylprolyl cis-trans isomerase PrsA1 [Lacticaseibacillus brantae DSM 23927]
MKKWLVALTGMFLALTLAGCAGSTTIANMKGAKITQDEYYKELKQSSAGQSTLRNMIVTKALEEQYGSKVKSSEVTKKFNEVKKQYGSSWSATLEQNGLTESSFKDQIKSSLLLAAAIKDQKKVTNADLKKQFKTYEPKITVQHILVKTEAEAKTIIADLAKDNSEKNFAALAKKNSTDSGTKDDGGKLPAFDNTDTQLDSTFKTAAFKLKQGQYTTTPVKTQYGYHVIRSIKNPGKGTMAEHKKELTDQIYAAWEADTTVQNQVITKVLKKAGVSIKDNDLKNVLSGYLSSSSSSK